jgi:cation transport regulator ChaB
MSVPGESTMQISEDDRHVLTNALYVAADQYRKDRDDMARLESRAEGSEKIGYGRLKEAFDRQQKNVIALLERIEL